MNKVVTTIAPTRPLRSLTDMKDDLSIIKRTAAYCRVSTDSEEQSEVINELFLSNSKVFDKISKLMETVFKGGEASAVLQESIKKER